MVPLAVNFEMQSGKAQHARMLEIQYARNHGGIALSASTTIVTQQNLGAITTSKN